MTIEEAKTKVKWRWKDGSVCQAGEMCVVPNGWYFMTFDHTCKLGPEIGYKATEDEVWFAVANHPDTSLEGWAKQVDRQISMSKTEVIVNLLRTGWFHPNDIQRIQVNLHAARLLKDSE
jgi:hypothetical protein